MPSPQAAWCAAVVDEWCRAGVRHAVVCPGSRSTPMALALAAHPGIEVHVRLDERSGAYLALGIGLESAAPAVLLTTSGTAAAEAHPAVVEAHQARVPLIVCTADRPSELHGVGAPQTIDQAGLYGGATRYACDLGVPDLAACSSWRSLGARLVAEAVASPRGPGPVHLNVAFRDPLDEPPADAPPGRPAGRPWHEVAAAAPSNDPGLAGLVAGARRPVVVAGAGAGPPGLVRQAAAALGAPLLADPRSGCRDLAVGGAAPVVAGADSLLRAASFRGWASPDLVVRLGEAWASKVVNTWLSETAAAGAEHVLVDPFGEWRDPGREVSTVLRGQPVALLEAVLDRAGTAADPSWASGWARAEEAAQRAFEEELGAIGEAGELAEPLVARELAAHPASDVLVVSSSMPVRDLEWFSAGRRGYPRVLANRGANGIDGVVSTAIGVALSRGSRGNALALVGDLAFLHDLGALVRPASAPQGGLGSGHRLGVVVVDNGGGGIFEYLGQAATVERERFEQLFGTPQAVDVAELARGAGCSVTEATGGGKAFSKVLDGFMGEVATGEPAVLVCRVERARGRAVHEALERAVAASL